MNFKEGESHAESSQDPSSEGVNILLSQKILLRVNSISLSSYSILRDEGAEEELSKAIQGWLQVLVVDLEEVICVFGCSECIGVTPMLCLQAINSEARLHGVSDVST